ncbi:protein-L-isoaspartate O-methyltransferase 1 isoform X2 [Tanacetum coccineum]
MEEHLQLHGVIQSMKVAGIMETIDKVLFVPDGSPAYEDSLMQIGFNATISAPHMHATCLQLLEKNLQPRMTALDVGSGTRDGLDKFLRAASTDPETILHHEFMQDYKGKRQRGKKTDSSSSSINRMMMSNDDDDDDDDDVPKRMNKSQPRMRLCDCVMEKDEKNVNSVPETQQSRISSLKRANKNVVSSKVTSQSSGSYLLPEVEMELQEALHDLSLVYATCARYNSRSSVPRSNFRFVVLIVQQVVSRAIGGSYHRKHRRGGLLYDFKVVDGGSVQLGDNWTCTIKGKGKVKILVDMDQAFIWRRMQMDRIKVIKGFKKVGLKPLGYNKLGSNKLGHSVKRSNGVINVFGLRRLVEQATDEKTKQGCLGKEERKGTLGLQVGANIVRPSNTRTGMPARIVIITGSHCILFLYSTKKLALKATIMLIIERKSVERPQISLLGNDSMNSRSAKLDVRIDKNMRIEVEEEIKETASAITKTMRDGFPLKKGIPVSWLYPPGSVKAAANAMVAMMVATTIHWVAVFFIQVSSLLTNSACFVENNSYAVQSSSFFICL